MAIQIHHGDILYAETRDKLQSYTDSYIIVNDGVVQEICPVLPEQYRDLPVTEHGRGVIIPAFSDLHVHAPQYAQRGLGMDCLLSDWLNSYTFPEEARFADMDYARPRYDAFVDELIKHGSFHAAIYATIHREATDYLFRRLEEKGLYAYVGKVNMDVNSPDYLCETPAQSLMETESYLEQHSGSSTVRPILTPRFAPTCSRELIWGLGKLGKKYNVGMQTHVVESIWEAQEAVRLFPDCSCDSEIYRRAGLLDNGPAIFGHVIFPSDEDMRIMEENRALAVHCPEATVNVIAGAMPLAKLQEEGIGVAIGSDVGAGCSFAAYKQVARAVQLSKIKEFYEPGVGKTISFANAFYCATRQGGSLFGKAGSLEKGYRFDAIVIDGMEDEGLPLSPEQRLERFCYYGDDRNITARYIAGREI